MFFPREAPRAGEIMTAAAASSSSQSPPAHRSSMLRGKPRSRLPLPNLKPWANQRLLKCVRLDTDGTGTTTTPPPKVSRSSVPAQRRRMAGDRDASGLAQKERVEDDQREAAGAVKLPAAALAEESRPETAARSPTLPIEESGDDDGDVSYAVASRAAVSVATSTSAAVCAEDLPWNLRTRRSTPTFNVKSAASSQPSSRPSSGAMERREAAVRRRRPRFSLPLTKEEIDEDLYAFTGRLPARRPKKRLRSVQKQIEMLFPGLCLSEVTMDMYQVADPLPSPPP